jgi:two-component system chemotaxis response regulator CheB
MSKPKLSKSTVTEFSCPDCIGVLKVHREDNRHRDYRCQVGHHFSTRTLLIAKEKEVERVLWSAAALLEHVALVYQRLIEEDVAGSDVRDRRRFQRRIREARQQKVLLTRIIEHTHASE